MAPEAPICPTCEQPASRSLAGPEHDWECRNEACPEFGQPIDPNERESEADEARREDRIG